MVLSSAGDVMLLLLGFLFAACHALENTTAVLSEPPVAAAVRSTFLDCTEAHSDFCFHGTCRFLVQEAEPACICHPGYVGIRCEHADLLAVVAANQKKQTITALVVVSVVATALLIVACILMHSYLGPQDIPRSSCCSWRKQCEWCRSVLCRHKKPDGVFKGGASCCKSETVV